MKTKHRPDGIDPSNRIHEDAHFFGEATLGTNIVIGDGSCVGNNVTIGSNSTIGAHVILQDDVVIGAGAVIGAYAHICYGFTVPQDSVVAANKAILDAGDYGRFEFAEWPRATDYWEILYQIHEMTKPIGKHANATDADRVEAERLAGLINSDAAIGDQGMTRMSVVGLLKTISDGIALATEACPRLGLPIPDFKEFANWGAVKRRDAATLMRDQFALGIARVLLDSVDNGATPIGKTS